MKPDIEYSKVEDPILNRQRDLNLIRNVFLPVDQEVILHIPLSQSGCDDGWVWHFDAKGAYSVRLGYRLAMDMKAKSGGLRARGD